MTSTIKKPQDKVEEHPHTSSCNRLILFSHWLHNRSCPNCRLSPLCRALSRKEIALLQLFQLKSRAGQRFLQLNVLHAEFFTFYPWKRDSDSTFYSFINQFVDETGLIIKVTVPTEDKKNGVRYSLHPAFSQYDDFMPLYFCDPDTKHQQLFQVDERSSSTLRFITTFQACQLSKSYWHDYCPIGLSPLAYLILGILEIFEWKGGLTLSDISEELNNFHVYNHWDILNHSMANTLGKGIKIQYQSVRRSIRALLATGVVISPDCCSENNLRREEETERNKSRKYYANPAHFLINQQTEY